MHAAEGQIHFLLECDAGNNGIALLADDVRNDIHMADADGGVGENARVANVVRMIVTQNDVSHGDVMALEKLFLEPLRGIGAAVVAVDDDDALVGEDVDAVLVIRTPPEDVFGDLLDRARLRPKHAVLSPGARQNKRRAGGDEDRPRLHCVHCHCVR